MKIKGITLRVPPVLLLLIVLFAAICAMSFGSSHNPIYIYIGIPIVLLILIVPLFLTYTNEKHIRDSEAAVRSAAKFVRARQVTAAMGGKAVILEGKIIRVSGLYMNRPVYVLQDTSGLIVVKRFALPQRLVGVGAVVEVLGYVYGRVSNRQSVYINAFTIKPIAHLRPDEPMETSSESSEKNEKEKIHIKHY